MSKCLKISFQTTIFYCLIGIAGLSFSAYPANCPFDPAVYQFDEISFSDKKQAIRILTELQQNDFRQQVQHFYCQAVFNYNQGVNDTLLIPGIMQALNTLDEKQSSLEQSVLQYSLALMHCTKGDYPESFTWAIHALDGFKQQNDSFFITKTNYMLGNICTLIRSYKLAEEYYNRVNRTSGASQHDCFLSFISRCNVLSYTDKIDAAIDSLVSIVPVLEKAGDRGLLARACINLGGYYGAKNDIQQSLRYSLIIKDMIEQGEIDNDKLSMTLYQNFGFHYIRLRNFERAGYYFNLSKKKALENNNTSQLFYAFYGLSQLYEQSGNADSAYVYLKECYFLRNQLSNNPQAIEAYQAYVSEILKSSEQEVRIAEQEIELKNKRFTVTWVSLAGIVLFFALLLVILQQKKKWKEAENKDLQERLLQEVKMQNLQQEKIDSQIREISSCSLMISNKNQILQQISEVTKHHFSTKEELMESNRKVNQIIQNNLNIDKDWNDFITHFDQVHPKFFDSLKALCNDLTENNLRICAYFRIGMSTKQIALLLNIQPEAVRKMRYRLKKRFGLEESDDLDDFLRKI